MAARAGSYKDGAEGIVEFREESHKIGKKHRRAFQMLALNPNYATEKSRVSPSLFFTLREILQLSEVTPSCRVPSSLSLTSPLGCREGPVYLHTEGLLQAPCIRAANSSP